MSPSHAVMGKLHRIEGNCKRAVEQPLRASGASVFFDVLPSAIFNAWAKYSTRKRFTLWLHQDSHLDGRHSLGRVGGRQPRTIP